MDTRASSLPADELLTHVGWIRALALRLVRDVATADDVVQETLLAALERRPDADRPIRPWLGRVVRNRAALLRRRDAGRARREEERSAPEALPSSAELAERAEAQKRLVAAVLELRDPYRSVILLRFFEGLEPAEIARRRGIPPATVRSHLARGVAQLRDALDERYGGERRAWSLALVPLAADELGLKGSAGVVSSFVGGFLAMQTSTKLSVGIAALALAAAFVYPTLESAPTPEPVTRDSPAELEAFEGVAPAPLPEAPVSSPSTEPTHVVTPSPVPARKRGPRRAPLVGWLVDEERAIPLSDFAVEVYAVDELVETVWTDGAGRFETEEEFRARKLTLRLVDHPALRREWRLNGVVASWVEPAKKVVDWDPEVGKVNVRTAIGPTYGLDIRPRPSRNFAGWVAHLSGGRTQGVEWSATAPLRGNARPWVRFFPFRGRLPLDGRTWKLEVVSADGLWAGRADVPAGETLHEKRIRVDLERRARLEVSVYSANGERLHRPDLVIDSDDPHRIVKQPEARDDGNVFFVARGLLPGEYRIQARADGAEPVEVEIRLRGGEVLERELGLAPRRLHGHLSGELRRRAELAPDPVQIVLTDGEGRVRSTTATWERRQRREWVAQFDWEGLGEGSYELSLVTTDHRTWEPALPRRVDIPADGLVFTCLDEATLDLTIRAVDHESGEAIHGFTCITTVNGSALSTKLAPGTNVHVLPGVPLEAPVEWCVVADGYAPAWGNWSDFRPGALGGTLPPNLLHQLRELGYVGGDEEEVGEVEKLVATARLERGWGARFRAVERGTDPPLPVVGAQVLLDGQPAGWTDAEGRVELKRDTKPARIDVDLAGWHLVGGDVDPKTSELPGATPVVELEFSRND